MNGATGLLRISPDLIPFVVLGLGGFLLVVVTILHGYGLDLIVERYRRGNERLIRSHLHPFVAVLLFSRTTLQMLFLHLLEICLWGVCLFWGGLIANVHTAVYFAANTYTTLGMGPMPLPQGWHELSPIIAISGLFTFAWTTSELFNIVGYQRELLQKLRAPRLDHHEHSAPMTAPER